MRRRRRSGFVRTLEGAAATLILLSFIFYVIPQVPEYSKISEDTKNYVTQSIKNMEKSGALDNIIGDTTNMTYIKNALNTTIPRDINYTISVTKVNTTSGTVFSEESYKGANITYIVNNSIFRYAEIILSFTNSTNSKIYENGKEIYTYTGPQLENDVNLDLTLDTIDSENNIEIRTENNSSVDYILIVGNEETLENTPKDKAIGTVTYILSGKDSYFQPSVLKIYLWR